MKTSRRGFLRISASAAAVAPWTSETFTRSDRFEQPLGSDEHGPVLLYSNENAYGPSAKVLEAIRRSGTGVNRYPRLRYGALVERIAAEHRVTTDRVMLGAGSTEILRVAALAFLGKSKQLIHASPTFEAMEHYATSVGSQTSAVSLTPAFAHDLDEMLWRLNSSTGVIYVCNPNNPTATLTPRKDIETLISKLPASVMLVIDEAYHHYAGTSAIYASFLDRPVEDERVIVARTFSKVYGMAGLRLGYAVAAPKAIERMRRFANEDNVNAVAAQAAFAALDDYDGVKDFVERNLSDRQEFFNQAMARALKPIDSHANFVMMNTTHPAEDVIAHFRRNNIMIGRRFPPMDTYIRVSLGQPQEMLAFWHVWDTLPYPRTGMAH